QLQDLVTRAMARNDANVALAEADGRRDEPDDCIVRTSTLGRGAHAELPRVAMAPADPRCGCPRSHANSKSRCNRHSRSVALSRAQAAALWPGWGGVGTGIAGRSASAGVCA